MEKEIVSKNQIVNQLLHIGHGDLNIYKDIGLKTVQSDPELFAHLISWNSIKGEVRDSKVAFPPLALRGKNGDFELYENAIANMCLLDPRNLVRSIMFNKSLPPIVPGAGKLLKEGIEMYLKVREKDYRWWDRTVLQHKKSMKTLYALFHIKPKPRVQRVLFEKTVPQRSIFQAVRNLKDMKPQEAAGTILNYKIPFNIAVGALGKVDDKGDVLLALMEQMSGAELINNTNMLKRLGVFANPVLKMAYDDCLKKAKADKKVSTLKAGKAAEVVGDEKIAKKLQKLQEEKLEKLGGIEGDWLVLGDRSGSMQDSIELAKEVAGFISRVCKGKVYLIFFAGSPRYFDVSGKSLDEIKALTKRIYADGNTSIGCGLHYLYENGIVVNGIALCSDGGENSTPYFADIYKQYEKKYGISPSIYFYHVPGDPDRLSNDLRMSKVPYEFYEMGRNVDYYSLPNIIQTMRANIYSLLDEVLETPLLTFNDVFK